MDTLLVEKTFKSQQNVVCGFCRGSGETLIPNNINFGEIEPCNKCYGKGVLVRETEGVMRLYNFKPNT